MELIRQYLLPGVWSFFACAGFAVIFNIRGAGILISCFGGALGWVVYLLAGSTIPAAFLAAVFIGLYAETIARVRHCPVTGYVLVALLPLVPGGGIYHAMRYAIRHFTGSFLVTLLDTFGMAAALAVGSMLSSSLFRTVWSFAGRVRAAQKKKEKNQPVQQNGKREE